MFFFPEVQNLRPISLISFTEEPSTIVFDFKNDNPSFCNQDYITLRVPSLSSFHVQIMENI